MTSRTNRRGFAVVAGLLTLLSPTLAAPVASGATRTLELDYVCTFPLLKPEPLALSIEVDMPTTTVRGKPTGRFIVRATGDVSAGSARGLRALESATIEGESVADAQIELPGLATPLGLGVTVDVEKTTLPPTGGFSINATGFTPSIILSRLGTATVKMRRELLLTLTPRLIDGTPTGLDVFETECLANEGQNMTIGTIEVIDGTGLDTTPPSRPGAPTAVPTTTSVSLAWPASTDDVGVTGYQLFKDGVRIGPELPTPVATVENLLPDTEYRFSVRAVDAAGNLSPLSTETVVRTQKLVDDTIVTHDYSITGSSQLKTLTKGPVPLSGSVDSALKVATGDFTANLALKNTRARLIALGFIPITADIGFIQSGQTTGTLKDGLLATSSLMKIRIPQVYLFGAIPIAGAGTCQTKRAADIKLSSGATPFVPGTGGTLAGTFAISDLTGCGALNGLLSPLVAGGGNSISIKLTGQAGA